MCGFFFSRLPTLCVNFSERLMSMKEMSLEMGDRLYIKLKLAVEVLCTTSFHATEQIISHLKGKHSDIYTFIHICEQYVFPYL